MPLIPDPVAIHNERMKLVVTTANALAQALVAVATIRPLVETGAALSMWGSVMGLALHGLSHYLV
jgi:hypothetical protein